MTAIDTKPLLTTCEFIQDCTNSGRLICHDAPENLHVSTLDDDFNIDHITQIREIVRAVNSHEQLLDACKAALRDLQMEADPEAYWVKQATGYLAAAITAAT